MTRRIMICFFCLLVVLACRSNAIRINVTFERISGLVKEDRVLFEGNSIGRVLAVQYNTEGSYTVQIEIDEGFSHAVTQYSHFNVVKDPALADRQAIKVTLSQQGGKPLESGTTVSGDPVVKDFFGQLQKDLESGFAFFKEQVEKLGRDVQQYPESEEYKNLKKSLEELATEIEQKERETREKIKREWLPKIQRQLDQLREALKRSGREQELEPLEKEVERIRRI